MLGGVEGEAMAAGGGMPGRRQPAVGKAIGGCSGTVVAIRSAGGLTGPLAALATTTGAALVAAAGKWTGTSPARGVAGSCLSRMR